MKYELITTTRVYLFTEGSQVFRIIIAKEEDLSSIPFGEHNFHFFIDERIEVFSKVSYYNITSDRSFHNEEEAIEASKLELKTYLEREPMTEDQVNAHANENIFSEDVFNALKEKNEQKENHET